MWTVVYLAAGKNAAMKIIDILENEGFVVKTQFFAKDGEEELYEILAPEFEAKDIQKVLYEMGII